MGVIIEICIALTFFCGLGALLYRLLSEEKNKDLRRKDEEIKRKDQEIERLKRELNVNRSLD